MFNISSNYNRKKPTNNIYSSLTFSAFVHIKSHFSFSAHHCSGATHCSPKIAVSCLDIPRVTPGVTGKKLLQQMNGIKRGSSGGGQGSAGVTALPAKGTGSPPGRRLQLPAPLSPTGRTALPSGCLLLGGTRGAHSGRCCLGGTVSEATSASQADPGSPRKVQTQPGCHQVVTRQPVVTWVSQCPQWDSTAPPAHIL